MEMESSFFDQNPDLLELVHKIDYVDGQSNIVKHYLYKDPDLAEIQSQVKEKSHDGFYEEIEIINEYSITSHCENFLEDTGRHFAISDRKRAFENRYSEASTFSEYSEQDSAYSSSCYPNNQYQDFDRSENFLSASYPKEWKLSSGVSRTEEGAFGDNMVPSDAHFRTVISSGFLIKEYAYPVYVVPISKQTTNGFLETLSLKKNKY